MDKKLSTWINPKWYKLYCENKLRENVQNMNPYEHAVLDGFLKDEAFDCLKDSLSSTYIIKNQSRAGLSEGRRINWHVVRKENVLRFLFSKDFAQFVSMLSGQKTQLKEGMLPQITEFLPGSSGFSLHNDASETFDFIFLLYIENKTPSKPSNGAFCIHDNDGRLVQEIDPVPNRLIVFKVGADSYHSVNDIGQNQTRSNLSLDWVLPESTRAKKRMFVKSQNETRIS